MAMRFRFVSAVCFLIAAFAACSAESVQAHHARVELLSEAPRAAGRFLLGIHFSLEKDWHIYWVNPGDSGQPPVLKWQLPAGFSAGEIEWPVPEKLKRSTLADYGYQDDVVLLVPVRAPRNWKADTKFDIGLQAKWLICREICIPDHADFHLTLRMVNEAKDQASIEQAKNHLPKPWPRGWKVVIAADKENLVLSIVTGKPVRSAEFYPLVPEQIENAAPQPLESTAQGARITLKKSDQLLKPITMLKGLLVLGEGEAYEVKALVTNLNRKAHN